MNPVFTLEGEAIVVTPEALAAALEHARTMPIPAFEPRPIFLTPDQFEEFKRRFPELFDKPRAV